MNILDSIGLSAKVIDQIFLILVMFTSIVSLLMSSRKNSVAKNQVLEMAASLELLIERSAELSQDLDRNLALRRDELTRLLQQIDKRLDGQSIGIDNHLLGEDLDSLERSTATRGEYLPQNAFRDQQPISLMHVADDRQDKLSLSQRVEKARADGRKMHRSKSVAGANNRNRSLDGDLSQKVARRLLLRGESTELVAKKLELPMDEVERISQEMAAQRTGRETYESSDSRGMVENQAAAPLRTGNARLLDLAARSQERA